MSLYSELKRRNVFRVAIAYLAVAWLLIEVAGTLFPAFGIPDCFSSAFGRAASNLNDLKT